MVLPYYEGIKEDMVLTSKKQWWLPCAEGDESEQLTVIRRNIEKGLPCGSETFLKKLEKKVGGALTYRPPGWPKTHRKKG
jgi:hypothetical protein